MVVVYLGVGFLFLMTDVGREMFPNYRTPLGIVMITYAVFRAFTAYRKMRNDAQG